MGYRIWLDDVRAPPDNENWTVWAKTIEVCKVYLEDGRVEAISFDHDLGTAETGYTLALYIERLSFTGKLRGPIEWYIHSMNPVGAKNIRKAMENAERFWGRWGK